MKIRQFTEKIGFLYTKICDVSEIQRKIRKKRQTNKRS